MAYKIYRFYKNGGKRLVKIVSSLEVARLHCNDPRTASNLAFDGFVEVK
jgi:hypothetical protein